MRIRVERSGGMAGLRSCYELNTEDLPPNLENLAELMINNQNLEASPYRNSVPKGAADHYAYRITIIDGTTQRVIVCNQYNMTDNVRSIIKYVENSDKKLK